MIHTKDKISNILKEIENNSDCNFLSTQEVIDKLLDHQPDEAKIQSDAQESNDMYKFDMDELDVWRQNNNNCYNVRYYNHMVCNKPIIGKLIILINKLFRKFFKFIGEPIVEQQNRFNSSVTASINALFNNEIVTQNFIDNMSNKFINLKNQVDELNERLKKSDNQIDELSEKLKLSDNQIDELSEKLKLSDNQVDELSERLNLSDGQIDELKNDAENIRRNSLFINNQLDYVSFKIHKLEKNNFNLSSDEETEDVNNTEYISNNRDENTYQSIDYFDFENHFRGIRENIKNSQRDYVKYFVDKKNVLDLGCGRGEFLELLKENGINAVGIDLYEDFVDYCNFKNLKAINNDIIKYIENLNDDSVDGIMCSQVVEHLSTNQILSLCSLAYKKLQDDSYIVIETPNPTSLSIYMNWFFVDPSHVKPIHPKTLEYFLRKAGFKDIQIIYTEQSKVNYRLPLLDGSNINNIADFNDGINLLSDIIFGSQDYAIIARK